MLSVRIGPWWVFGAIALLCCLSSAYALETEDLYCGRETCYEVLGLEQEASNKEIRKAFRSLSLLYHPDKNSDVGAVETFRSIANAYAVLTQNREEYDDLLRNPEKFLQHQWRYYRYHYTHHHTSVWKVLLGVAVLATTAHFMYWRSRYFSLRSMMLESPEIQGKLERERLRRLDALHQEERLAAAQTAGKKKKTEKSSRGGGRATGARRRGRSPKPQPVGEEVEPAVVVKQEPLAASADPEKVTLDDVAVVNGWQGRLPVFWKDNLLIQVFLWFPIWVGKQFWWYARWIVMFRILKQPYGEEELAYITSRELKMTWSRWESLPQETKEDLVSREVWKPENMLEWRREMKQSSKKRW